MGLVLVNHHRTISNQCFDELVWLCCRRGGVSGRGGPAWSRSCHGAAHRQMPPPCPLHGLEGTDASGVAEHLHRSLYLQVSDGAKTVKLHQGHFPL